MTLENAISFLMSAWDMGARDLGIESFRDSDFVCKFIEENNKCRLLYSKDKEMSFEADDIKYDGYMICRVEYDKYCDCYKSIEVLDVNDYNPLGAIKKAIGL